MSVHRSLEAERALLDQDQNASSYRIGFLLGREKMNRTREFYASTYNPNCHNVCDVMCAYDVWSYWLVKRNLSTAYYVAEKMETLELHAKFSPSNGERYWTVSGKSEGPKEAASEHIADDVAVCVVMSVSLCTDLHHDRFKKRLVRLEPLQDNDPLDAEGDAQAIINVAQGGEHFRASYDNEYGLVSDAENDLY